MTVTVTDPAVGQGRTEAAPVSRGRNGRLITDWRPEDDAFWASTGRRVARRNLWFSVLAENLGFSVWLLWSVVVVHLPAAGFTFTVDQLFWLVALPNLVGGFLRLPYTVAVARFGGRSWTTFSALLLLVPVSLLAVAVTRPDTPYWFFLLAAATAGVGGGNFASSMANISFFYPDGRKGLPLGLNAAGGNLGASSVQLLVPFVIGIASLPLLFSGSQGSGLYLQNAGLVWVPLILVSAACAWFFMDNLSTARSSFRSQVVVTRRPHTWIVSVLYVGTFGSFIGFSAGLPLLISTQFPDSAGARYAFLGALVGAAARPVGGWLADRFGGAPITCLAFTGTGVGVLGVLAGLHAHSFVVFLLSFMVLFATTGMGNGSIFRMIPAIFLAQARRGTVYPSLEAREAAFSAARRESAAVLGFTSALGAIGGFVVPKAYGTSLSATGSVDAALIAFLVFYAGCIGVTWWFYLRRRFLTRVAPSLVEARI